MYFEHLKTSVEIEHQLHAPLPHRAMFKLGGEKMFVLCLLVKNVSAVTSAHRCKFKESEKAAQAPE